MKAILSRLFLVLGLVSILALAACGGGEDAAEEETDGAEEEATEEVASDEQFELRLATVVNPPHPWVDLGEFFAEEVEKRTDGNVTVSVHHSATLGDDEAIIDEMLIGTIDFIAGGAQNAAPYIPQLQIFGFSYLFDDMEMFEEAVAHDSPVTDRFKELFEESNHDLVLLGLSGGGTRYTSHKDKQITEASDMEGVKMRLPGSPIESKIWGAVGAVPTSLPWNEVYSGVQTGVVDSFESTLSGYEGSKLHEVAPNVAKTEHLFMASHFTMSGITAEKLPAEYLEIIKEVAIEASYFGTDQGKKYDQEVMDQLEDLGVNISEVDKETFQEKVEPLYEELAEEIDAVDILEMIMELKE